jgi:hypothetical protein
MGDPKRVRHPGTVVYRVIVAMLGISHDIGIYYCSRGSKIIDELLLVKTFLHHQ